MTRHPRSGRSARTVLIAGMTLFAAAYASGVLPVPDVGAWVAELSDTLGSWTYVLVPALAFLETAAFVGLLAPGETAVLLGGAIAERGEVSLPVMIALVWAAAVAGDVVSLLLGRRFGPAFLRRYGPRVGLRAVHLERVERTFERHGGRAILLGRFVGLLRAFTPFVAGSAGLTLRRMLPYSAAGALVWATAFTVAGYAFSSSFVSAGTTMTRVTLAVAVVAVIAYAALRSRRGRSAHDARTTRSAAGRRASRGVWKALTPSARGDRPGAAPTASGRRRS